jgi:predicted nuclease of restriction endonuclease-like (RecB) superfamily
MNKEYKNWLQELKQRIRSSQIKAAVKVNTELIALYWRLGQEIINKEKESNWGSGFLNTLSDDLKAAFPEIKGFSLTNLKYIRLWVNFYLPLIGQQAVDQLKNEIVQQPVASNTETVQQAVGQIGQQAVDQMPALFATIPWGHHLQIITKCKNLDEALFYIQQTAEHGWSRNVLVHQLESGLYKRKGAAVTNFHATLPKPQSDLARELLKDPYKFDFLSLGEEYLEKDLENALIEHITKFLLELGAGFSYVGRQYHLEVGGEDFYIDLLFYHLKLRCFVVLELKTGRFVPEYASKLNFYLNVVDDTLKHKADSPSIGILICKERNKVVAEYALRGINKPIGVSEYQLTEKIPAAMKGKLPTIKQIEKELKDINEHKQL